MMKILITGGTGQLGWDCARVLKESHQVKAFGRSELDITDESAVDRTFSLLKPQVVINCAAYTKVDDCEKNIETAERINGFGPACLSRAAAMVGAWLVHISTDYVFDGEKEVPEPYDDEDPTSPLSAYGRSKLNGEHAIQEGPARYTILRTAWVYGIRGNNFLKAILKFALDPSRHPLKVVSDQFGSLTWSYRLALQIAAIMENGATEIFHATAEGYGTWYDVASFFLSRIGIAPPLLSCSTAEFPRPAHRPRNSILENRRLKELGINLMRDWKEDLALFVDEYREELLRECSPQQKGAVVTR